MIASGDNIFFWYDNWIENGNLISILRLFEEDVPNSQAKVYDFIQQGIGWDLF